jgi:hypothetical protein
MLVVLWIITSNIPNYVNAIFHGVPGGSFGGAWHSTSSAIHIGGNIIQGAGKTLESTGKLIGTPIAAGYLAIRDMKKDSVTMTGGNEGGKNSTADGS